MELALGLRKSLPALAVRLRGIGYHLAKRCTEYGFDLVVAAAIEQAAGNCRVPGVSIDYGQTPALRTQVIAA